MTIDQTIQVFGVIGTWFSGVVTVVAIWIAYILGTKNKRIIIKSDIGIRVLAEDGIINQQIIYVAITNINEFPLNLNSMTWQLAKARKKIPSILVMRFHELSSTIPTVLSSGQSVSFLLELSGFVNNTSEYWLKDKNITKKDLNSLCVNLSTPQGRAITLKAPKELIEIISAKLPQIAASKT